MLWSVSKKGGGVGGSVRKSVATYVWKSNTQYRALWGIIVGMKHKHIVDIVAQCPKCKAVKVPRKAYPGHYWQCCLVLFPNKKEEVCELCSIKESKTKL